MPDIQRIVALWCRRKNKTYMLDELLSDAHRFVLERVIERFSVGKQASFRTYLYTRLYKMLRGKPRHRGRKPQPVFEDIALHNLAAPESNDEGFDYILSFLKPRSQQVLRWIYGPERLSLTEVAARLGVAVSRVNFIHQGILKFLKKNKTIAPFCADNNIR
jgi:DNA-directed RNA polymerase specialized sigma24 family protein